MTMNNFELKYFSDSLTKEIGKAICYRSINCKNNNRSIGGAGSRARRTAGAGWDTGDVKLQPTAAVWKIVDMGNFPPLPINRH